MTGVFMLSSRLNSDGCAGAIDDLLWQLADNDDTNIVIYGIGKDEPLNDNTTRRERRANRRVEFYIVPLPLKL